jgi:AAA+ ATPase superfamily predicted ATPase
VPLINSIYYMLKFYNREKEIALLEEIQRRASEGTAQMTFVTGRRRIGKTALLSNSFDKQSTLYFFVERKN